MNHSQISSSPGGHMMPAGGEHTRALVISGWLTGVYCLVGLAIGIWTGSAAVFSDAFRTCSAIGDVLIALVAPRIPSKGQSL